MECSTHIVAMLAPPPFVAFIHHDLKGQDMANVPAISDSENPLMKTTSPARTMIDRKSAVSNISADLVELHRRLSDLVDGFVRLSHAGQVSIAKPENPNQWNFFEYANAILSIAAAHGGAQFQRPLGDRPVCYRKNLHQSKLTGPCAMCMAVRSSLLTKSYCSQAETC
jgi:hypothetical protein